jgi:uncharacterized membrane protein
LAPGPGRICPPTTTSNAGSTGCPLYVKEVSLNLMFSGFNVALTILTFFSSVTLPELSKLAVAEVFKVTLALTSVPLLIISYFLYFIHIKLLTELLLKYIFR